MLLVDACSDVSQQQLLMGRWHTTENSVVTTLHTLPLVGCQMNVLRHDERTCLDSLSGYAPHDGLDVLRADLLARLYLDVALSMADKHLTGHLRVYTLCVAEVNDCPSDSVCHLVRVTGIHFFKHDL